MKNEEKNLNTEENDIAGNPVEGPAGNTAARHAPANGLPGNSNPALDTTTAESSESLADSETSVGRGAVGRRPQRENKDVDPNALKEPARRGRKPGSVNKGKDAAQPSAKGRSKKDDSAQPDVYGGNFGNSTHDSFQDRARYDNQTSDANRGEFGPQGPRATHGGFGNQYREADYERHDSAEDRYYGGPGRYGHQHNSYRDYDGRDDRRPSYGDQPTRRFYYDDQYDQRRNPSYGPPHFDAYPDRNHSDHDHRERGYQSRQQQSGNYNDGRGNRYDNRNQPERGDYYSDRQNDNGSRQGRGAGYADDYGRTSLPGQRPYYGADDYNYDQRGQYRDDRGNSGRRNQDEDYRSSRGGYDNQGSAGGRGGHREEDYGARSYNYGGPHDDRSQRPDSSRGYGDRGRDDQPRQPNYRTGDDRNGYGRSHEGDTGQGYGSRGGSYNDQYDDSRPGSREGSPARGDYRREDGARNYGTDARGNNRRGGDDEDYGSAPRRNRGRDHED